MVNVPTHLELCLPPPNKIRSEEMNSLVKRITNIKGAIEFLEECRNIHQAYIDNPHWRRGNVGKKSHHENCVARYNETINLLK